AHGRSHPRPRRRARRRKRFARQVGAPERALCRALRSAPPAPRGDMSVTPDVASLTLLQADLLRAAFGADETAVAAWRRRRDAIDWEAHLDHDAFRLLPRT